MRPHVPGPASQPVRTVKREKLDNTQISQETSRRLQAKLNARARASRSVHERTEVYVLEGQGLTRLPGHVPPTAGGQAAENQRAPSKTQIRERSALQGAPLSASCLA